MPSSEQKKNHTALYLWHNKSHRIHQHTRALDALLHQPSQHLLALVVGSRVHHHHTKVHVARLGIVQNVIDQRRTAERQQHIAVRDLLLHHAADGLRRLFHLIPDVRVDRLDQAFALLRLTFVGRQLGDLPLDELVGVDDGHGQRAALLQIGEIRLQRGLEATRELLLRRRLVFGHHLFDGVDERDAAGVRADDDAVGKLGAQFDDGRMDVGRVDCVGWRLAVCVQVVEEFDAMQRGGGEFRCGSVDGGWG